MPRPATDAPSPVRAGPLALPWEAYPTPLATPFPAVPVPSLRPGRIGSLRVGQGRLPFLVRGYFTGLQVTGGENWLMVDGGTTWMSCSPAELESVAPLYRAAVGDVVVMGLGLGVLLAAVKHKPGVRSVTVVEMDPRVVTLCEHLLDGVEVVVADARVWRPDRTFDVVLADIWPRFMDEAIERDLVQIAGNVRASSYAAWSIEPCYFEWATATLGAHQARNPGGFARYAEALGVPLALHADLPDHSCYEAQAAFAAENLLCW